MTTTAAEPSVATIAADREGFAFSPSGRHGVCLRRVDEARTLEYWALHSEPRHRAVPHVRAERDTRAQPLDDGRVLVLQRDGHGYEVGLLSPAADEFAAERLGDIPALHGAHIVAGSGRCGLGFVVAVDDLEHSTVWRVNSGPPWLAPVARVPGALTDGLWLGGLLAVNQASERHRSTVVVVDPADGSWRRIWSMSDTSVDRIELASARSGLFVVTTTATGGPRLGWGILGEPALRFPETLHRAGYLREAMALDERGERVLLHEVDGAVSRLLAYTPAQDRLVPLSVPPGTVSAPASWRRDLIRFSFSAPDRPATLITLRTGAQARRPSVSDGGPGEAARLVPAELVELPGPAGPIEAVVYGGPRWRRSRHLVVALHGGPLSSSRFEFDPLLQRLAAAGIAVVTPNYRGSTGYGDEHLRAVVGDWGGPDLDDVRHLGRALQQERATGGLPAPAVLGASYGAFLALLAACREPTLWSACIALAPFLSGPRLHATADPAVRHRVERLGGLAGGAVRAGERDVVQVCRALAAPLLLVHGTRDPTIPVEQSRTLRRHLLDLGRTEGADLEYLEVDSDHDGVVHARREDLRAAVLHFCLRVTRGSRQEGSRPRPVGPTEGREVNR